ncbi:hypothetical protein [Paenibacillus sp. An7]|uniref:Nmad3 family putative nucleotide modification protein n=1 Tax=Paenibacillus sp. An7 TaxID=2689577 RepID=UPI003FA77D66
MLSTQGQRKRSGWKLPNFFHPSMGTKMSYHENILSKSGKRVWENAINICILNSVGRGQEFIIEGNKEVENWAKELIQRQFT